MRLLIPVFTLTGTAASAHPGHIVDAAGHNHWVAGIALGAAGIAIALGALKGRKDKSKPGGSRKPEAQAEEQPA